jgi:hypothetical protein
MTSFSRLGLCGAALTATIAVSAFADSTETVRAPAGAERGDGPGRVPPAAAGTAKRAAVLARRRTLPRLDVSRLLAEDARETLDGLPGPKGRRTGVVRNLFPVRAPHRLRPGMKGVTALPGGGLAWTAEVASPGAAGLRLHFSRCVLPDGVSVVVYDADEPSESYGAFTGAGPHDTGAFWTPTVLGDRVRVELRVTADAVGAPLALALDRVAHQYASPEPMVLPGMHGQPKAAQSCEIDVQCDSSFSSTVAHGVARISFVSGGNTYDCSGCLLNDNDATTQTPWFLTAYHCISTLQEANSCQFYWDYYASGCGGTKPSLSSVPQSWGATLIATSSQSDATLLKITGSVPGGRSFVGWTSGAQTAGIAIYGVHHPAADVMKISYGSITFEQQDFHDVVWTNGVTEGGSSGSPLLNASQQVLGQLWGGSSSCSNQSGSDSYGRFDVSYPQFKPYIFDITGTVTPPPSGGGSPPPGPAPGPGPVGEAPEFFLGLWQGANLGKGAFRSWRMGILKPTYNPGHALKLKIEVKGRPGAWAKLTDPLGKVSIHPKGKSFVKTIYQGYWPLELHAAEKDAAKLLKVRVTKNW